MRFDRVLLGLAVLFFVGGIALRTAGDVDAQALGPVAVGGDHPWVDFGGTVLAGQNVTLFTVPADRVFVLSGGCYRGGRVEMLEDSTVRVVADSLALICTHTNGAGTPFAHGRGHLTFPAGSQVRLQSIVSSDSTYYFEGYLAHP